MVEPVDPFEGRVFHRFEAPPRPTPMDHLGLVEAIDGLSQSIVTAVADAADRGLDPGFREALGTRIATRGRYDG